jgi:sucrose-phosphate synthase
VLSTSLTISEIHSLLISAGMVPTDFDAFICNSGSDLFYPSQTGDSPSTSRVTFALDRNYQSHVEYHWGGEGLRKYLVKWASSVVERRGRMEKQVIFDDSEHSSTCCLAFRVVNPNYVSIFIRVSFSFCLHFIAWNVQKCIVLCYSFTQGFLTITWHVVLQLPPLKELQKLMRVQSLRCHALYNHSATRLSVIPIHASRSQAIRFFSVSFMHLSFPELLHNNCSILV